MRSKRGDERERLRFRVVALERELAETQAKLCACAGGSAATRGRSDEQLHQNRRRLEIARRRHGELRVAVTQQLQAAAALRRLLAKALAELRKKLVGTAALPLPRPTVAPADAERVRRSLFATLAALSRDVDRVLEDAGLARCSGDSRRIRIGALAHQPRVSGVEDSNTSSDGGLFVEVTEACVLPFSVQETSATMWEFFRRGSKSLYGGAYTTFDVTSSEIFGCYAAACVWNRAPHEISGAVAMRRIDEPSSERVVNVWSSRSTLSLQRQSCESCSAESSPLQPLLRLRECGWSVLEPLAVAPGDVGPVAVLKVCTHVTLSQQHEVPEADNSRIFFATPAMKAAAEQRAILQRGGDNQQHQPKVSALVLLDEITSVESPSSSSSSRTPGDPSRAATLSEFAICSQARDSRFFLRALESALVARQQQC